MDVADGGEEFEVERILADNVVDGQTVYLVKWRGYGDEECTWEPAENFNSPKSLAEWKDQKARDLGLPEEFLVSLQKKMDDFQARSKEVGIGFTTFAASAVNYDASIDPDLSTHRRFKKQKKAHDTYTNMPSREAGPNNKLPQKKGIAVKALLRTNTRNTSFDSISMPRTRLAVNKANSTRSLDSAQGSVHNKIGQQFRNLSHRNNARKKARQEPPPNLTPDQLRSVEDLEMGHVTAHILPVSHKKPTDREQSPLFFPDEHETVSNELSRTESDEEVFPPARVDHRMQNIEQAANEHSEISRVPGNALFTKGARIATEVSRFSPDTTDTRKSSDAVSKLQTNKVEALRTLPKVVQPAARGFQGELPASFPSAPIPSSDRVVRANNGRSWYRGDIMCNLSMGNSIGDATIVHLPFHPFGSHLVGLKVGETLALDFESRPFDKCEYDKSFKNSYLMPDAVGLIHPFPDTQQAFDEFAAYLEQHDSAAIFHFPKDQIQFSMVLYSVHASSWSYLGWQPARTGRPRLHVAFVPKLIPWGAGQGPSTVKQPMSTLPTALPMARRRGSQGSFVPPTQQQTTIAPTRGARSPSISADVAAMYVEPPKTPKTPRSPAVLSEPESTAPPSPAGDWESNEANSSTTTPRSPNTPHDLVGGPRIIQKSVASDAKRGKSQSRPRSAYANIADEHRLNYGRLLSGHASNRKLKHQLDQAVFFVTFATSHPPEAELVRVWLERSIAASHIYLDSERFGWSRFREKAYATPSVLLFHNMNPNYNALPGLGSVLMLDALSCFSLSFKHNADNDLDVNLVRIRSFFPRAMMYLITESMILDDIERTIAIVRYFDKVKHPGYYMMTPPNVEHWMIEQLGREKNHAKQIKLLDFLVLVRNLRPKSDIYEVAEDDVQSTPMPSYIISPRNIPGYDVQLSHTPSVDEPGLSLAGSTQDRRDNLLRSYFYCYAAANARLIRRFVIFIPRSRMAQYEADLKRQGENGTLDSGHVIFHEVERFVEKMCHRETDKNQHEAQDVPTQQTLVSLSRRVSRGQ